MDYIWASRYASIESGCLTTQDLRRFLVEEQLMDDAEPSALIDQFEATSAKEDESMTLAGFTAMMTSPMFDIMDPQQRSVFQDMDRPLSHYYIASSHNT